MAVTIKKMPLLKSAVTVVAAAPKPAIAGNALEVEDEFTPYYNAEGGGATGHILKPPYDPRQLEKLCQENNTLGPCIEAMVINIDGTGFEIERENKNPDEDEDEAEDPRIDSLSSFFKEPFPGVSFINMRKELRRDLERTGNAYLEVLRNMEGQIVFLRHVPSRTIRLVKLDKAIMATKKIERNGEKFQARVMVRERRYVQLMSGQLMFFREFGSTRDLDKKKGKWAAPGAPISVDKRATELIHFKIGQDPNSPYGVPRWEGQIPSVMGSRSAEETNLTYLQAGGLPPALIMIQGGMMAEEAKQAIAEQFGPGHKTRAAIVELASTEGTMEKPGQVKVSVERFGSENMKDSMYQTYDEKCGDHVLSAFRIPPIFVGRAGDHNFATAYASYITAEAQVFGPERKDFDSVMTHLLLPALGGNGYVFKSNPITIKDASVQVSGISTAASVPGAEPKSLIKELNEVLGLSIEYSEEAAAAAQAAAMAQPQIGPDGKPLPPDPKNPLANKTGASAAGGPKAVIRPIQKGDVDAEGAMLLADRLMVAMRARKADDVVQTTALVDKLSAPERAIFERTLAVHSFVDPSRDPEGLADIAGCTMALIQRHVGR